MKALPKEIQRNLDPHKPAVIAMWIYGHQYSKQAKGAMDFWDGLPEQTKKYCRELLKRLNEAPEEIGQLNGLRRESE